MIQSLPVRLHFYLWGLHFYMRFGWGQHSNFIINHIRIPLIQTVTENLQSTQGRNTHLQTYKKKIIMTSWLLIIAHASQKTVTCCLKILKQMKNTVNSEYQAKIYFRKVGKCKTSNNQKSEKILC